MHRRPISLKNASISPRTSKLPNESSNVPHPRRPPSGVHAGRTPCCHCHYRDADRPSVARGAAGARGGVPFALPASRRDPGGTVLVYLLPYVEQTALATEWDLSAPQGFYVQTVAARQTPVPLYFCPSRRSASEQLMSRSGDNADSGGQFVAGA